MTGSVDSATRRTEISRSLMRDQEVSTSYGPAKSSSSTPSQMRDRDPVLAHDDMMPDGGRVSWDDYRPLLGQSRSASRAAYQSSHRSLGDSAV